jgi:hypothetical protein
MRVRLDYTDGHYSLFDPQGREVDVPLWAMLLWRVVRRLDRFLDRKVFTPADNAAFAKAEKENR